MLSGGVSASASSPPATTMSVVSVAPSRPCSLDMTSSSPWRVAPLVTDPSHLVLDVADSPDRLLQRLHHGIDVHPGVTGAHRAELESSLRECCRAAFRFEHQLARALTRLLVAREQLTMRRDPLLVPCSCSLVRVVVQRQALLDVLQLGRESSRLRAVCELEELERVGQRAHAVAVRLVRKVRQQRRQADRPTLMASPQQLRDGVGLPGQTLEHTSALISVR